MLNRSSASTCHSSKGSNENQQGFANLNENTLSSVLIQTIMQSFPEQDYQKLTVCYDQSHYYLSRKVALGFEPVQGKKMKEMGVFRNRWNGVFHHPNGPQIRVLTDEDLFAHREQIQKRKKPQMIEGLRVQMKQIRREMNNGFGQMSREINQMRGDIRQMTWKLEEIITLLARRN